MIRTLIPKMSDFIPLFIVVVHQPVVNVLILVVSVYWQLKMITPVYVSD